MYFANFCKHVLWKSSSLNVKLIIAVIRLFIKGVFVIFGGENNTYGTQVE